MEQIDLTTADQTSAGTLDYRVVYLTLSFEPWQDTGIPYIVIGLRGLTGIVRSFRYEGAIARQLMVALNTANLSTKSLQRRILERLIADGLFVGSISGTPDTV